jgi:hypothetical protein
MTLTEDDLRPVALWAADCVERVLPLFEAQAPSDLRPREAIEGARVFGRGAKRTAQLRTLAWAAWAARNVGDPAASAVARAATAAAGTAYTHPLATLDQGKHILGPAAFAAHARELAANGDIGASEEEIRWALAHASPAVREVAQRFPARDPGRGRLNALLQRLDAGLRS